MRRVPVEGKKVAFQLWVTRRFLLPLCRLVDLVFFSRWLFGMRLMTPVWLVRWRLNPYRLRQKAKRLSGLSVECFHLCWERIDERLARAADALERVESEGSLAGCGVGGG